MSGDIRLDSTRPLTKIQSEGGHRYFRMGSKTHMPITLVRTMTSTTAVSQISQASSNEDDECFCLRMLFPPIIWCCLESIGAFFKNLWESVFPPPPVPIPDKPSSLGHLSPAQRKTLQKTLSKTMTGTMHQINYPCVVVCGLRVLVANGQKEQAFDKPAYDPVYMAKICGYYSKFDAEQFAGQVEQFSNEVNLSPLAPENVLHISQLILSYDPQTPDTFGYVIENLTMRGGYLTEDKAQTPEKGKKKAQDFYPDDIGLLIAGAPGLQGQLKFEDLFHKKNEVFRLRNTSLETDVVIWKASEQPSLTITVTPPTDVPETKRTTLD